jgi:hypothetical protein
MSPASRRDSGTFGNSLSESSSQKASLSQIYKRVLITLQTHDGPEKITPADVKMAKFIDQRSPDVKSLDARNFYSMSTKLSQQLLEADRTESES